jgi:hypothetical protein
MAAGLIAATSKPEVDARLQQLATAIITTREQVRLLENWRAPHDLAYLMGLGYTQEQIDDLTAFITITAAWTDQIGAGGTMSANDGSLFARLLTQIYGISGLAGIVTAPPAEP